MPSISRASTTSSPENKTWFCCVIHKKLSVRGSQTCSCTRPLFATTTVTFTQGYWASQADNKSTPTKHKFTSRSLSFHSQRCSLPGWNQYLQVQSSSAYHWGGEYFCILSINATFVLMQKYQWMEVFVFFTWVANKSVDNRKSLSAEWQELKLLFLDSRW